MAQLLPGAAAVLARPAGAVQAALKVWPAPGVLVIFWFLAETQIDFDVDLRELQGQQGADTLSGLLRAIGTKLGKPVLMVPEGGSQEHPVIGFDPALNKVTLLAVQHPADGPGLSAAQGEAVHGRAPTHIE